MYLLKINPDNIGQFNNHRYAMVVRGREARNFRNFYRILLYKKKILLKWYFPNSKTPGRIQA